MSNSGRQLAFIVADIVGLIAIAILLPLALNHKPVAANVANCAGKPSFSHVVTIQNSVVTPSHTAAFLCDTLTITNLDDITRAIAFGPHENHVAYDGVSERIVAFGQSLKVTLVQAGNFRFHDHIHDEVQGTFTVVN